MTNDLISIVDIYNFIQFVVVSMFDIHSMENEIYQKGRKWIEKRVKNFFNYWVSERMPLSKNIVFFLVVYCLCRVNFSEDNDDLISKSRWLFAFLQHDDVECCYYWRKEVFQICNCIYFLPRVYLHFDIYNMKEDDDFDEELRLK